MFASSSRFLLRTLALTSLLIYGSGASQPAWAEESSVPPPLPAYATTMAPRVQPLMEQMLIPGAVVAVRSPECGDWTAAFGYRDLARTQPITVEDHFRIGSNTKTMTGTVVLQLVDEGKVHLEDPISDYVDGVPNGEKITLDLLLRMRSGLTNYTQDLSLNEQLDTNRFRIWTPSELLALAFAGPEAVPNSEYEYCNTNTVLLGKVIEKVLQQPAEEAVTERIFQRLGLAHTLLPLAGNNSIPNPHPRGYMFSTNVATIESSRLSPSDLAAAFAGTLLPSDQTESSPSWTWTAGSGISTVEDLAVYARALGRGQLISDKLQQARLASLTPIDPSKPDGSKYGWGMAKLGPMLGHTGSLPGFNSFMGHDPERDLTVIVLTNLNSTPQGQPPAVKLAVEIMAELYGKQMGPRPLLGPHPDAEQK